MQQPSLPAQVSAFRKVGSDHGVQWWGRAWQILFNRGAAIVWIVMCVFALVILALMHLVPVLGWMAAQIGWFLLAGGLMLAARKTDQGTVPTVGDLFAGFGPSLAPLAIGGALVMVAMLLVAGAAMVAGLGAFIAALDAAASGGLALLATVGVGSLLAALIALVVLVPVFMAAWLAPALIVLRQRPPVEALKESFSACSANLGPLTVYGLLGIAFAILATILLGLGWLIAWPLMVLSTYAAYQDLFEASALTPGLPPAAAGQGS
jgi:uncharacterized membrane protein